MSGQVDKIKKELNNLADKEQARISRRFFKSGKGEYGEGDVFLGIKAPRQREVAKKYQDLSLTDLKNLLNSYFHEHRFTALIILVDQFKLGGQKKRKKIYDFYLRNTARINNWDLVDLSAQYIIGEHLADKPRTILYELAGSNSLWKKRIALVSAYAFIKRNDFYDIKKLAEILINDGHDLIHKAAGWMLREVGKRDQEELVDFLDKYTPAMPRTMLRYAIERLPEKKRLYYLNLK